MAQIDNDDGTDLGAAGLYTTSGVCKEEELSADYIAQQSRNRSYLIHNSTEFEGFSL